MRQLRLHVLSLLTISTFSLSAQDRLALINDSDGFTNVRNGKGTDFNVIDTLFADDLFYFSIESNSDWASVIAWRGRQIEGFIHKSRIKEVQSLDNHTLKNLILNILEKQRLHAENFTSALRSNDELLYRNSAKALENHSEAKYTPILTVLPTYFCSTDDSTTIDELFATVWADQGSASEMPSFSIGTCFVCNPNLLIDRINNISNSEQKQLIFDHIIWGLLNHFDLDNEGKSDNEEFNTLIQRVNLEREK